MKTLKIILCSLCFCSSTYLFAQSDEYLNAYVIDIEGDTLRGYIKDEARKDIAKQFNFRENLDGAIVTFSPTSALGFFMAPSFYFESIEVKERGVVERRFVRKLLEGYANLYKIFNEKEEYLLIKENGEKIQISSKDSLVGNNYIKDVKYFGELKYFMRDCPEIVANTKSISFSAKEITRVLKKYNQYKKPDRGNVDLSAQRKLKINIQPTAGVGYYQIFGNYIQPPSRASTFEDNKFTYHIGALVSIAYFRKIAFQTGIIYNQVSSDYIETYSLGYFDVTHDFSYLRIPLSLKYNFTAKGMTPYFYGGLQFGKAITNDFQVIRVEGGTEILNESYSFDFNRSLGFLGGIGLSVKLEKSNELNMDIGFNNLNFFTSTVADIRTKGITLNVGYLF